MIHLRGQKSAFNSSGDNAIQKALRFNVADLYADMSFLNLVKSNGIWIVIFHLNDFAPNGILFGGESIGKW